MADNRANPLLNLLTDLKHNIVKQVSEQETTKMMVCLSETHPQFNAFFKTDLNKLAWERLAQAIIDDDRNKLMRILDANPHLLLLGLSEKNIEITSQYTWQRFFTEDALMMAAKRKQIKMIELLLPYYNELEQTQALNSAQKDAVSRAKAIGLSTWSFYEMRKNKNGETEIDIPAEYTSYLQSLIDLFVIEDFPNGTNIESKLSKETEEALILFRAKTLPNHAVKLDYLDTELFMHAFYQLYADHFSRFQNLDQREHFCVKIGGWIQSLLSPETGKILCEGLYYVVEENRPISKLAESLKFLGGKSFYRSSPGSLSGLGGKYLCAPWETGPARGSQCESFIAPPVWKKHVEKKQQVFRDLCSNNHHYSEINSQSIMNIRSVIL